MKRLLIAICVLLLSGNLVWAETFGNQYDTNPIVIRNAAIAGSATVQLNGPRFITNIVWYIDETSRAIETSFILENGRNNEILKDRNWQAHKPTIYNLWIPVQGIHMTSITSGTELFIYTGRP